MHRYFLVIVATGLQASTVLAAPPVAAQSGATQAQSSTATGLEATAKAANEDPGNRLYDAARERYRARDLLGAVDALKQCYELTHESNVLFNIGQVYGELNDCASAVEYYRRYLQAMPQGEGAGEAEQYIRGVGSNCSPIAAATEPVDSPSSLPTPAESRPPRPAPTNPPSAPEPDASDHSKRTAWTTAGWVSLGVAGVATGVALVFSVKAYNGYHELSDMADVPQSAARRAQYEEKSDEYIRDRNWLAATAITAGATAAFGVIALTVLAPRARREIPSPSVSVVNGATVVSVGWAL